MKCDRCNIPTASYKMSFFNTDMICKECEDKEKKHPDYQKARDAEEVEIKKGNYNFPGIGLPKDL